MANKNSKSKTDTSRPSGQDSSHQLRPSSSGGQQNKESVSLNFGKFGSISARGENPPELLGKACKEIFWWVVGGYATIRFFKWGVEKFTSWIDKKTSDSEEKPTQPSSAKQQQPIQDAEYENVDDKPEEDEEPQPEPVVENMAVLVQKDCKLSKSLIGDLICSGDSCIVVGGAGQMKSILAMQLAIEISTGSKSSLVPNDVEKEALTKAFYYNGEMRECDFKQRYGNTPSLYLNYIERISNCAAFSSTEELLDDIKSRVLTVDGDVLVVLDNCYSLFNNQNESTAKLVQNKMKEIKQKANGDVTFILIAHTKKDSDVNNLDEDAIYGSSFFRNLADVMIGIAPVENASTTKKLTILKTRGGNKELQKGDVLYESLEEDNYLHFELINNNEFLNKSQSSKSDTGTISHAQKVQMWQMNKQQGVSYSMIVEHFKKQDVKVSRSSVGNYVNEIDAEQKASQQGE